MLFPVLAALFFVAQGASAQSTDALPCAVGCVSGTLNNGGTLGCAVGDTLCMCGNTDAVRDGIEQCTTGSCGVDADAQIPLAQTYANELCAAASSSASAATATATATAATTPATTPATTTPETTQPSSTDTAASPTTAVPVTDEATTTSSPSPTSSESTTGEATTSSATSTSQTLAASSSESPSSASTGTASSSGTSAAATLQASSSDEKEDESSGGLSTAVKAGIGAGVGVAVIMAVIAALCLCLRRKQKKKDAHRAHVLKISQPMPGSGRQYAQNTRQTEKGLSRGFTLTRVKAGLSTQSSVYSKSSSYYPDLEDGHARGDDDMLPRTQPRTMI
ncbi:hypothetical protein F5Y15DRAFT_201547 [Xylariaceae sp. FL0016]|nr:hypothetical protein F5Y15DRAFT_201547 [Xylariaceae sp. FL0016]